MPKQNRGRYTILSLTDEYKLALEKRILTIQAIIAFYDPEATRKNMTEVPKDESAYDKIALAIQETGKNI